MIFHFELGQGQLDGMVVGEDNQPTLKIDYELQECSLPVDVFLNGVPVGQLVPGQPNVSLPIDEEWLLRTQVGEEPTPVIGISLGDPAGGSMGKARMSLSFGLPSDSAPIIRGAYFSSGGITAPVPEPGVWAMLLAGLGTLGLATVRRRHG